MSGSYNQSLAASNGPLNKATLDSLGLHQDALQIFVNRFEQAAMKVTSEMMELLESLAKERLERAALIHDFTGGHKYSDPISHFQIPGEDDIVHGKVIDIHRYEEDVIWTTPLYIRQHLVGQYTKLQAFLSNNTKSKLYVTGAPGCGKTCFFWMSAGMLMRQKKRVLFLQYNGDRMKCQIWVLEDETMRQMTWPKLNASDMNQVVRNLLIAQTNKFDVCICDGIRTMERDCKKLEGVLYSLSGTAADNKISKLILVTSLQFALNTGERLSVTNIQEMSFDSWREEDFQEEGVIAAVVKSEERMSMLEHDWCVLTKNSNLGSSTKGPLNPDQILEVLSHKFHFAGGSARYMFDTPMEELLISLKTLFGQVKNPMDFTQTSLAGNTDEAVNSLMQQFFSETEQRSFCVPVSKYILLLAYEACRTQGVPEKTRRFMFWTK